MYMYMGTCAHVFALRMFSFMYIHAFVYVCMSVYAHILMHTCVYADTYLYVYVFSDVCTCIGIQKI